jgi:hypothetical protein
VTDGVDSENAKSASVSLDAKVKAADEHKIGSRGINCAG